MSDTQADQLPPLESRSATKYQPAPAAAATRSGCRKTRSAQSAAATVRTSSRSRPQWNPWSGLSWESQPNQSSSAPTKTAKRGTETNAKRPASSGRSASLKANAQATAQISTSADQPTNAAAA